MKSTKLNPIFQAIPFTNVSINDHFWTPRITNNRDISLSYQFEQLNESGVLDNFKRVTGQVAGDFAGSFWMDTDAYKWLEAASYSLAAHPDPILMARVNEVISLIASAQEQTGYINTYFQLVEPDKKFTNLGICHELYCAGHLIQAAVAHFTSTGQKTLLQVACLLADHIDATFGPGKMAGMPGHEEIEMALVELYRVTGEKRYLTLSQYFIDQRGRTDSRLRWELAHLDEIAGMLGIPGQENLKFYGSYENYDGRYAQDHLPVREQSEVVGHAVRAMYLYCAMADIAAETWDEALLAAMERLWQNVTARRMYITGGIGPTKENEGFTRDFDLPNDTAYAETCAAVGMIMWNYRLLLLKGESRFADIIERVLYNRFLSGVSLDGRKFFYDNPLQSGGDHHRQGWFWCACCPPNVARLLASLGSYIYSRNRNGLAVNLYIQSETTVNLAGGELVTLRQETAYPWEGKVKLELSIEKPTIFTLYLRIPNWCRLYTISINQVLMETPVVQDGYVLIERQWLSNDTVVIDMDMPIERIIAHPAVWQDIGKIALQRGPIVYCLEGVDHSVAVEQIMLPAESNLEARFIPDLLEGVVVIEGEALAPELSAWEQELYKTKDGVHSFHKVQIRAVPYYSWDNRTPGSMIVWVPEKS